MFAADRRTRLSNWQTTALIAISRLAIGKEANFETSWDLESWEPEDVTDIEEELRAEIAEREGRSGF